MTVPPAAGTFPAPAAGTALVLEIAINNRQVSPVVDRVRLDIGESVTAYTVGGLLLLVGS